MGKIDGMVYHIGYSYYPTFAGGHYSLSKYVWDS